MLACSAATKQTTAGWKAFRMARTGCNYGHEQELGRHQPQVRDLMGRSLLGAQAGVGANFEFGEFIFRLTVCTAGDRSEERSGES